MAPLIFKTIIQWGELSRKLREPRLAIEGDIHLSTIPSASLCFSDFQHLPNDAYCAIEAVSENIDEWRGHLVTKIKQYATPISDIQLTASNVISSSDLNARSFSSVLARLDHFAERLSQPDQIISDNSVKIQSLISSFDQVRYLGLRGVLYIHRFLLRFLE